MASKRKYAINLMLFLPLFIFSQNSHSTIESAYEIGSKGIFKFNFSILENASVNEEMPCLGGNYKNIFWIKWTVKEPGNLTFSISPYDDTWSDIDFAIFKVPKNKGLKQMSMIRCMESGIQFDAADKLIEESKRCLGIMGLSTAEPSDQLHEHAGCSDVYNNFLAPLKCRAGDTFYLAVSQFDDANTNYIFDLCGTAQLTRDSVFCEEYTKKARRLPNKKIVSFSNKISEKNLSVFIEGFDPQVITAEISSSDGLAQKAFFLDISTNRKRYSLPIENFKKGTYKLEMKLNKQKVEGEFVIN
ncbi:MAG: hypothetical protein AAFZ15_01025 [Bacteroidota bacterium]